MILKSLSHSLKRSLKHKYHSNDTLMAMNDLDYVIVIMNCHFYRN